MNNKEYIKPEIINEESRDAESMAACGQRYTMGCGALVEKW